ncbi:hypothetical protein ACVJGB_006962 [Bradyrhizobium liaoningense]
MSHAHARWSLGRTDLSSCLPIPGAYACARQRADNGRSTIVFPWTRADSLDQASLEPGSPFSGIYATDANFYMQPGSARSNVSPSATNIFALGRAGTHHKRCRLSWRICHLNFKTTRRATVSVGASYSPSNPRSPLPHAKIRLNKWIELFVKRLYFIEMFPASLDCFRAFMALQMAELLIGFVEVTQRCVEFAQIVIHPATEEKFRAVSCSHKFEVLFVRKFATTHS